MFISTRGNSKAVHASEAIMRGMVPEGGLYLPEAFPTIDLADFESHLEDSYQDLAKWILGLLLDDFTEEEIAACVEAAYNEENFEHPSVTPLVKLTEGNYILELWHGPTAAFKDLALQIMPHLLVTSLRKNNCQKDVVILVATSGDTGKAALEGFKNVPGTQVVVFYPDQGVSPMQELQMTTTDGNNTHVVAVKGNFDDCQTAVKDLFADQDMIQRLDQAGYQFSSANSINWGRLSPQVVYYVAAYLNLVRREQIQLGDPVDYSVPTGNFGNILAAYMAKEMGLPIGRLICASNENNVLTDFFNTGTYNANRPFYRTISPSMDILISSNLERYLYIKTGGDGEQISQWMQDLKATGTFTISPALQKAMAEDILAADADAETAKEVIAHVFEDSRYLLDPHTAVAVSAAARADHLVVVDATANPFKFVQAVSEALAPDKDVSEVNVLDLMQDLSEETNTPVHRALAKLSQSGERPHPVIEIADIRDTLMDLLPKA